MITVRRSAIFYFNALSTLYDTNNDFTLKFYI